MKHVVFKIKQGKQNAWKAWGKYLQEHKTEVLRTLEQENCVYERSVLFEKDGESFMVGSMEFVGESQKADMSIELNQKHAQIKSECLVGIALFNGNYHLPTQYEIVYEFDCRIK